MRVPQRIERMLIMIPSALTESLSLGWWRNRRKGRNR